MRRAAVALLVAGVAVAGCTHPTARPAGWKAVRYHGLSFFVPASWRVRDGRRFPCPGMLAGPAVVLGHAKVIPPCPMPQLRTPLLWIDDRVEDQLPATAVPARINGLAVRLLRLRPDDLGQASSDELMYWSQYRGASGFQVWVLGQGVRAELLDPAGGVVADQVLATLQRS